MLTGLLSLEFPSPFLNKRAMFAICKEDGNGILKYSVLR